MIRSLAFGLSLSILGSFSAAAEELRGPQMAVASNFGQGFLSDLMDQALAWGINDFRDAVYWDRVEAADGTFVFDRPDTTYPDQLADAGARMSLTVNNGHPAYDEGHTPLSPVAVAGFAFHAAETLRRFPAIKAIEIGNEFNGPNFVSGSLREGNLDQRAAAYVALLEAVATRAKVADPEVRIIGGGVHSIPTGYLAKLLELGAATHMDAIALHPYSTPVEHYAKQIAVMRRLPGLETMPVEITEFGTQIPDEAPGKMLRSHCLYGLAGASRLAWYAVNERGDDYEPLITRAGRVTPAGETFRFIQDRLTGLPVADVSPDPFTYACLYDQRILMIWGMPRSLDVTTDEVTALDHTGNALTGQTFTLSETEPLILVSGTDLQLGRDMVLGDHAVLADSYHGFTYPENPETTQATGGFLRKVRSPDAVTLMQTMPGQDRPGRPWTPWLGVPSNGDVRLLPDTLLPAGSSDYPVEIVHEYTAAADGPATLAWALTPSDRSTDGITIVVSHNGQELLRADVTGASGDVISNIQLVAGDTLEVAVGPGATSTGDVTDYRFTLRQAE